MTITLPNLDDRDFDDLVAEARSMIPQLAPSWTDHNPSDPGITLIELFAYICEMLMYRANCITDANKRVFLELLTGKVPAENNLDQQVIDAIKELRTERRAIANADFETYAKEISGVKQAYCRPLRNYSESNPDKYQSATAHVSVLIVPDKEIQGSRREILLLRTIKAKLESRKLLTTQLHVVLPEYYEFGLNLTLNIFNDYKEGDIRDKAIAKLTDFFDSREGGSAKQGWQPGQPVYFSEIYTLLDQLPGVDFIDLVSANSPLPLDRQLKAEGTDNVIGIKLFENELPKFNPDSTFKTFTITLGTANHND